MAINVINIHVYIYRVSNVLKGDFLSLHTSLKMETKHKELVKNTERRNNQSFKRNEVLGFIKFLPNYSEEWDEDP